MTLDAPCRLPVWRYGERLTALEPSELNACFFLPSMNQKEQEVWLALVLTEAAFGFASRPRFGVETQKARQTVQFSQLPRNAASLAH
jgi:hypothetical protein